jgi:HAMP domain-containing protein/HPt (histidine-containing phosphotransfer) domain-containing protein
MSAPSATRGARALSIAHKLSLTFACVFVTLAGVAVIVVLNLRALRAADDAVRVQNEQNELALVYRHAAQETTLGAAQLAGGSVMGAQKVREGTAAMAASRARLTPSMASVEARAELAELARVEALTVAAAERVAASVRARSGPALLRQDLAILSARADALNLRLEALFDATRGGLVATLAESQAIGVRAERHVTVALLACLLVCAPLGLWLYRSIAPPLARLDAGVRRIGAGELGHTIPVGAADELGKLTLAFNEMAANLQRAMGAVAARNDDMRIVLDHVDQGLLTLERDGTLASERSATVDRWLGHIPAERPLWEHLANLDAGCAEALELGFRQVLQDFLPIEVTLAQLPTRLTLGARHVEMSYRPVLAGEALCKLLVVLTDVSERVAREEARAQEAEALAIFRLLQHDRSGLADFFAEGSALVAALRGADHDAELALVKRQVHTLKGNAAVFGFAAVADRCHVLESRLADDGRLAPSDELSALCTRWDGLMSRYRELAGSGDPPLAVPRDEHRALLYALAARTPHELLQSRVARWLWEPVEVRLAQLGAQARVIAQRLHKAPPRVRVHAPGLRLPHARFAAFWSAFVHALRNAVDHGIETPARRERAGKPAEGTLALAAELSPSELRIQLRDDGAGIAWERVRHKALAAGLPAHDQAALVEALFADGVSTAEQLSEVSGRGVGMAALRDACLGLGGRVDVRSELGTGTTFDFVFPAHVIADEETTLLRAADNDPGQAPRASVVRPTAAHSLPEAVEVTCAHD